MTNVISRATAVLTMLALVLVACGRSDEGGNSSSAPPSVASMNGSGSTATEKTPLDGTYQTSFTLDELVASPLQHDEINDQNWGEFTLTFADGRVTYKQRNDRDSLSTSGVFTVQGDAVTLVFDEGGNAGETFRFRWSLSGDTLTFRRDGPGPAPYVLKPWARTDE